MRPRLTADERDREREVAGDLAGALLLLVAALLLAAMCHAWLRPVPSQGDLARRGAAMAEVLP